MSHRASLLLVLAGTLVILPAGAQQPTPTPSAKYTAPPVTLPPVSDKLNNRPAATPTPIPQSPASTAGATPRPTPVAFSSEQRSLKEVLDSYPLPGLQGDPVPMTLRDVVLVTLANNLNIQISRLDREISGAEVLGQYGKYDPLLDAGVARSRDEGQTGVYTTDKDGELQRDEEQGEIELTETNSTAGLTQLTPLGTSMRLEFNDSRVRDHFIPGNGPIVNPQYAQSAGIEISQPLPFFKNFGPLVNNAPIRIAGLQLEQSNYAFREEIQNRLADVMIGYWELVFAIRNLEVELQALESARELERVNKARVDVGQLPRLALAQARAEVASRESRIAEREAFLVQAQDNLLTFMNWDRKDRLSGWNRPILPTDEALVDPNIKLDDNQLIDTALILRPDYQGTLLNIDIAAINRDVTRRQRMPELNTFLDYKHNGLEGNRGNAFDTTTDGEYTDTTIGAEFLFPLFNRRARADYQQALDIYDQSELTVENLELDITREVRAAARAIRATVKRLEATDRQVAADVEKLDSEMKRMSVGERTTFDVLDFQDDLVESRATQARAQTDYQIAMIELARRTGLLLEMQGVSVEDEEAPGFFSYRFTPVAGDAVGEGEVMVDWLPEPETNATPSDPTTATMNGS